MDHRGGRPDLESCSTAAAIPCSYKPLPGAADDEGGEDLRAELEYSSPSRWWKSRVFALSLATIMLVALGAVLRDLAPLDRTTSHHSASYLQGHHQQTESTSVPNTVVVPPEAVGRGVRQGVSDKSSGAPSGLGGATSNGNSAAPWTNEAFRWQRSAFHFQPEKNWMNDPNGPLFYKGWYHFFYQYNPDSAVWGNITWGHAVSRDLVHWFHLPLAMVRDQWYDAEGVFTGSATILPDGRVVMLYTGSTDKMAQVQNLAYPEDPTDPLLLRWVKSPSNPVLSAPPGIGEKDFRDPSTAWYDPADESWRIVIGSKDAEHAGIALVYRTKDFLSYDLLPGYLHEVPGTGMWECVDFYPVSTDGNSHGLDTSVNSGPGVKHVLKASLDDDKHDYYAVGTYDAAAGTWTPVDPEADVGIGLRYDYGKFYAAKTFYDGDKKRRVLWGWIGETDSEGADVAKGWASLQAVPRTVRLDEKTQGANLVQWPVEEFEKLRASSRSFSDVKVGPGEVVPLDVGFDATQLDINAEFGITKEAAEAVLEADVGFNCSSSGGASQRGALGPFGLLVLADDARSEQTAVYFYVAKGVDGKLGTFVCQDDLRSSQANDIVKRVYGSTVPVLDGEKLTLRVLVDHSIVETFAQGGRTCITSRVYPTAAIYTAARIFLFNNATDAAVTATSVDVWQMNSARIRPYQLS